MKKNIIIFISIISISFLVLLFFKINQKENKKLNLKQKVEVESSGIAIKTVSNLQISVEQELFSSNIFDNIISNENIIFDNDITNSLPEKSFVTLEIMLSGELNTPFEGNVSVQTHDFLKYYPDQNIKKEISGDCSVLFEKVTPGDCKINTEIKGYLNTSTNVSLSEYLGNKKSIVISLTPLQSFSGKVIDYITKEEIAGAELSAFNQLTYTDGAGKFLIENLLSDIVNLQIVHDNYPTQTFKVSIPKHNDPDVVIELKKMSKISGYVIDQNGVPTSGCKVIIPRIQIQNNKISFHDSYNCFSQTSTDEKGFFEFEIMKTGSAMVRFLADSGEAVGYTDLRFNPGEEHEITIVISNVFSWLEIIVQDTNMNPITSAAIFIVNENKSLLTRDNSPNGTYMLCFDSACTQDLIMVESDGFMAKSVTNIFTRCNYTTTVEFILQPVSGELIGKMERSDGRPVPSKLVMFFAIENSNIFKYTFTDLAGNFVISSINPDYHYLVYSKIPVASPKEPVKGSEYYNIKLEPYSEVRFQALATNSFEVLNNVIYKATPTLQKDEEFCEIAQLKNKFYNIIVTGSGYYYLYLRPRGYKPIIIHRKFNPDEDVDLGTIYFTPQNKKQ